MNTQEINEIMAETTELRTKFETVTGILKNIVKPSAEKLALMVNKTTGERFATVTLVIETAEQRFYIQMGGDFVWLEDGMVKTSLDTAFAKYEAAFQCEIVSNEWASTPNGEGRWNHTLINLIPLKNSFLPKLSTRMGKQLDLLSMITEQDYLA